MGFRNREHAARQLVDQLRPFLADRNPLIMGIPQGAVPMARIIADVLAGELDVVLVRKLGHPDQPEFAIGAIDESGNAFLKDWACETAPAYLEREKARQVAILRERRARYAPLRAAIDPSDRLVIVVDDGTATGSTMTAALRAVRARNPEKLIAAVAVASSTAARAIVPECDAVVCLRVTDNFFAVGQFFDDFTQVSDHDVIAALRKSDSFVSTFPA